MLGKALYTRVCVLAGCSELFGKRQWHKSYVGPRVTRSMVQVRTSTPLSYLKCSETGKVYLRCSSLGSFLDIGLRSGKEHKEPWRRQVTSGAVQALHVGWLVQEPEFLVMLHGLVSSSWSSRHLMRKPLLRVLFGHTGYKKYPVSYQLAFGLTNKPVCRIV